MKDFLKTLLASLDSLTVKGKENMDILLGCMMAIEKAIEQLDKEDEEAVNDG